jgi:NAD(P)-dependent dehydrogenase (short-subunit alcohol dehydrogenase family)
MRLKDKVAVVTGGGHGIGEATSLLFAEEGARVAVADIDREAGESVAAAIRKRGGEAVFVAADVSTEKDAEQIAVETVRAFGQLNILVNNAAAFILKGLDASPEDWQKSLSINVIGTALVTRYAVEAMKHAGGGAIVNLGSISGFVAQPEFITYSATKAALIQMTRNMALDLAPLNIRVNCVCPGTIMTQAIHHHMELDGRTLEEFKVAEGTKYILGRIGQPREVAYAVLFLASDEASFITGTHLMVDGGYTAL